ncbi:hypothetical protein PIB30_076804 [Stylosanthes scabra]|uniref:30S ribosomal protein S20, chloroplastic n=1 Tax=Stylosanthes scabra TaxID=79078 RepID=A0ABU6TRR0_9FABA|nr:hypothetical protein [Stylosanthes scabra]
MAMAGCALASTFPLNLNPLKTKNSSSNRNSYAVNSHLSGIKISYLPSPTPLLAPSPKFLPFQPLARSMSLSTIQKQSQRSAVVCEAAPQRKTDSAVQRARLAEKRRVYNKARKSEIRTRMRKVLEALEVLRKKSDPQAEEIVSIEKLIGEAYSVIDKAVRAGTLHRNTGANRKSRLARRKKLVEIHHGWYTPAASEVTV